METYSDTQGRSRISGALSGIRNTARNARDMVKDSLHDVQERLGSDGEGLNWKRIISIAAVAGTVGAIALRNRRNKRMAEENESYGASTTRGRSSSHSGSQNGRRRHH